MAAGQPLPPINRLTSRRPKEPVLKRLCRLMCGRAVLFRKRLMFYGASPKNLILVTLSRGAAPKSLEAFGRAQPFRTSGGGAASDGLSYFGDRLSISTGSTGSASSNPNTRE